MSKYIRKYDSFINRGVNTEIPLPNDIIEISNAYIKAGKDIFLVGGAVRDFIQGIKPKDYDLVTNALPNESKEILNKFNVSDEQGKKFGVLRVYTKDEPEGYEIASYRRDISGGRDTRGEDQKVEMGGGVTIEDDCKRRDLTMNALFYDIKNKKIVDLVGGVQDIKNGIIRTVGDASKRFSEDRLRICRIFRFAARTGGVIDPKTSQAIRKDNRLRGISTREDVSQERIWEEIKKAFKQSKSFIRYLEFFNQFDMWGEVFPGIDVNKVIKPCKFLTSYMAQLFEFADLRTLERKMVIDFRIEIEISQKVVFLLRFKELTSVTAFEMYKNFKRCNLSKEELLEWMEVEKLDRNDFLKFLRYKPSVSSKELMDQGYKGAELGNKIKELEKINFENL